MSIYNGIFWLYLNITTTNMESKYAENRLDKSFSGLFELIDYVDLSVINGLLKIEKACVFITYELWNIWDDESKNIFANNIQAYYYAKTNFDEAILKIFCFETGNELGFIYKEKKETIKFQNGSEITVQKESDGARGLTTDFLDIY